MEITLSIDSSQHFPLEGSKLQAAVPRTVARGQPRYHAQVRDLVLDARPFVHPPSGLHQEPLGREAHRRFYDGVRLRPILEAEVAFRPSEEIEDRLLNLSSELPLELSPTDGSICHQNVAEPARVARLLQCPSLCELLLGDLAGL